MISARDTSNAFLMDTVRAKERMQMLTSTTHLIDDDDIEVAAYCVIAGVVWTAVLVAWGML
jgi:hypothetical protein